MKKVRWHQKIGNQLLLLVGSILLVSTTFAVSLSLYRNYIGFQSVVENSLRNSTELRQRATDAWLQDKKESLDELARTVIADLKSDKEISTAFFDFLAGNQAFDSLFLLEAPTGLVRVATNPGDTGRILAGSPLLSMAKTRTWLSPFLDNPDSGRLEILAGAPLITQGKTRAILGARLSLKALAFQFQHTRQPVAEETAFLVAPGSRLVFGQVTNAPMTALLKSPQVQAALAGQSGLEAYTNRYGIKVFGAWAWVDSWRAALFVEIPQSYTVFSYNNLEWIVLVAGVAIAVVLAGLGFYFSRILVRPLGQLASAAAELQAGNYRQRLNIRGHSELAQTAEAFNAMAGALDNFLNALTQREKYYRNLIEHSSDYVFVISLDGTIRYLSPNVSRRLGYPEDQILGTNALDFLAHPNDGDPTQEGSPWLNSLSQKGYLVREYWAPCADGSKILLEATFNLLPPLNGEVQIVINARDITDKSRMEADLERRRKMDSLGHFSAGVADDFNNLLTGLMGYVSLFRLQAQSGHWDDSLTESMERSILKAKDLTQRLIIISSGGIFHFLPHALNDLVTTVVEATTLNKRCQLDLHLAPDLPPVSCDKDKILLLLREIFDNALNFAGKNLHLQVRTEAAPGIVRVYVRDNGPGIDPEQLPHIFDPYFSTNERAKGLGLTMAWAIMDTHKGKISLTSEPGQGTEVLLTFPAWPNGPLVPGETKSS